MNIDKEMLNLIHEFIKVIVIEALVEHDGNRSAGPIQPVGSPPMSYSGPDGLPEGSGSPDRL